MALGVSAALLAPGTSDAQTPGNPIDTERQLGEVRAQRGEVDLEVNTLVIRTIALPQASLELTHDTL